MATMTIRNIDDQLKMRLRIRAAQHGRSTEDGARDILRSALSAESARVVTLVDAIRARIERLGGIELEPRPREPIREAVEFDQRSCWTPTACPRSCAPRRARAS